MRQVCPFGTHYTFECYRPFSIRINPDRLLPLPKPYCFVHRAALEGIVPQTSGGKLLRQFIINCRLLGDSYYRRCDSHQVKYSLSRFIIISLHTIKKQEKRAGHSACSFAFKRLCLPPLLHALHRAHTSFVVQLDVRFVGTFTTNNTSISQNTPVIGVEICNFPDKRPFTRWYNFFHKNLYVKVQ